MSPKAKQPKKKAKKAKKTKAKTINKDRKVRKGGKGRKVSKAKVRKIVAKGKAVKQKVLGRVVHFYDKISVAIIKVNSPFKLGDTVCFKRGDEKVTQSISSLQVNHQGVPKAAKGAVVGVKVKKPIKEGAVVMAA
ncbi:hypothetical protein A3A67_02795 [Candidatus Peribacteria bacterium RIFCSPLOWO2_01_FULL_51_18]|nr:MAG: hypothetical protein A3C52_03410 [Candidatus Peribacteria bacterium RIFCSPHIGHO2_02_FULL_51_15]OGJ66486.1 MAG: hypothetical protein A3A67_02795 [Candidatus Peribacteria bacterium RIFCSPLOWO2_01_FULL_51_18]OGJ69340.1 MAG: hypothetical protein A3J34_01180 [Candidatus Peribacteria bacterium RIFCSPLOWO2_02_FULL_51_10]